MKIGLFGGSFDPIHNGHIRPVQEARSLLGLGKVIYLPTARPPHKEDRSFAPAYARYAMVEMALLGEEGLYVSPYELTLDRASYTVETVEHFRATYPNAQLHLLVGSDAFAELDQWRRWRDLLRAVDLLILVRPGWEQLKPGSNLPAEITERWESGRIRLVPNRPVAVSSSELRTLFAEGRTPETGLMPELVVDYIEKYSLYR